MNYDLLDQQLRSLSEGISYDITILANASALIWDALEGLNWCGFYLFRENALLLGPFQGKVACTRIPMGRGVCGTAAEQGRTVVVPDVHRFPGHIACDSASNSEIVIPLYRKGTLFGVLDIDSPLFDRFSPEDTAGLEKLARTVEAALEEEIM